MSEFDVTFETSEDLTAEFTDVVRTPPTLQTKSVTVTQNGQSSVEADDGYDGLEKVNVTTNVPNPSTGKVNITSMNEVDVTDYATAQVVDADLVAGNIKKDIEVLGVVGSFDSDLIAEGTYTPSDTQTLLINFTSDIEPNLFICSCEPISGTAMMVYFEHRNFTLTSDTGYQRTRFYKRASDQYGNYFGSSPTFTRSGINNAYTCIRQNSDYPIVSGHVWKWRAYRVPNLY